MHEFRKTEPTNCNCLSCILVSLDMADIFGTTRKPSMSTVWIH